eukprot:263741-Chlamydomonas_euryale.AAC.1
MCLPALGKVWQRQSVASRLCSPGCVLKASQEERVVACALCCAMPSMRPLPAHPHRQQQPHLRQVLCNGPPQRWAARPAER